MEVLFIGETLAIDIKNNKTSEQYIYEILMLVISINENNEICFVEPMILFYPIDNKEEFNKKFNFPPFKIKNVSKTRIIEINSYTIDSHEHNFIRHDVETTINKKIQLLMDDRGNFSYHESFSFNETSSPTTIIQGDSNLASLTFLHILSNVPITFLCFEVVPLITTPQGVSISLPFSKSFSTIVSKFESPIINTKVPFSFDKAFICHIPKKDNSF